MLSLKSMSSLSLLEWSHILQDVKRRHSKFCLSGRHRADISEAKLPDSEELETRRAHNQLMGWECSLAGMTCHIQGLVKVGVP